MIIKLEGTQKERANRLENQLQIAIERSDIKQAKLAVLDLQDIYGRFKQTKAIGIAKNKLYELAIETNDLDFAESGLLALRIKFNKKTRMHLEASALLAICYLRKNDLTLAEPIISEVLKNESVIKSVEKRSEFFKSIIDRFDEEATLYALRKSKNEKLDQEEITTQASLLANTKSEDQLFDTIGQALPEYAKNVLFRIDNFSKNQLPTAEKLKLPSPTEVVENKKVGKTLFSSAKRVMYKSLCDPNSDIYKAWFNQGMGIVLNKTFIVTAITQAFLNIGIGVKAIIIPIAALVLKFGIEVYCEKYQPSDLMNLR
jgi:hypothetical protein